MDGVYALQAETPPASSWRNLLRSCGIPRWDSVSLCSVVKTNPFVAGRHLSSSARKSPATRSPAVQTRRVLSAAGHAGRQPAADLVHDIRREERFAQNREF